VAIITTGFVWLVSVAESIIVTVLSFFALILLFFTFAMADILKDENGRVLYCETSDSGVEVCERREWSIVD
jgi:hypothetical protein